MARRNVVGGYEPLLTAQLVVAVINIHHFVVDAYIWRLCRDPDLPLRWSTTRSRRSLTPSWMVLGHGVATVPGDPVHESSAE